MPQPSYSGANGYIAETYFTIFFSIPLDPAHPPNLSAFQAQINGTDATIASIEINTADNSIKITFASATLLPGDIIDFVYTDPTVGDDVNAVQGLDGTDAASFSHSIVVAITRPGPSAPNAPTLDASSDSGTLGDFLTNDNTPLVNGTSEANATIKLYDTDGTTLLGTTKADGAGKWSLTSNTLGDGSHTLKVTQTNGQNQTSNLSNGLTLSIDTVANAPTSLAVAAGSDSGTLGDGISNVANPTINGLSEAFASISLYDTDGSTVVGTATADKNGKWSVTNTSNLTVNTVHTLTAKQTDAAGNVSKASANFSYTVDTVGPVGMALSSKSAPLASATNGSTVSSITSTDLTEVTYGFAVGNGVIDADNGKFTISGNSLKAAQNLSAGTYHIYLSGTDAAGNSAYQIFTFTVTDAPSVSSIVRAGAASSMVQANASSIDYTVTFSQSVTGVDASDFTLTPSGTASGSISAVTGSGSTYTVTVNTLAGDGTVRLDLKSSGTGIKNGSNADIDAGYTAGETYTLDHTAPNATSTPAMTAGTDTGASSSDAITKNTTPVFTGTGEANAKVVLYDTDGSTILGTTTADGSGKWSISSAKMSEGAHTLTIKQTDEAGNVSKASSGLAVQIDTTAPSAPATPVLSPGSDSGVSGDFLTNVATPVITGTSEANAIIKLYDTDGTTLLGTSTADGSGKWSVTSSTLVDGSHSLTVKQTDQAGNVSTASSSLTLDIDTSLPSTPGTPSLKASSDSATLGDGITNVTSPTLVGTGTVGDSVTLYDTDGTTVLGTAVVNGSGNWSINSSKLADGVHTVTVKQTNVAGTNSSASKGFALTIDSTAPSAPGVAVLSAGSDSGVLGDNITKVTTPVITGTAEANALVKLYDTDGSTLLGTTTADGSGKWSITSSALTTGNHSLSTKQTDAAGNVSVASSALTLTIDNVAPDAPATASLSPASDTGILGDLLTAVTTPVLTGKVEANATVKLYDTDGTTLLGTTQADGSGNWSITSSTLADGAHNLTIKQTDVAGNVSVASAALALTINSKNSAPVLAGSKAGQTTLDTGTISPFATVTVTDTDAGAGETMTVKLDDAAKGKFTAASLSATGFTTSDGGLTYSHTLDTPAAIQAALRGLVFQPAAGRSAIGSSETTTFTISVNDGIAAPVSDNVTTVVSTAATNFTPTDISLSANQIKQSSASGSVVGVLSSTDPNPGDSFKYSLVADDGGGFNNAYFNIDGNQLRVNQQANLLPGTYQVRVKSTDAGNLSVFKTLSVTVIDDVAPSLSSLVNLDILESSTTEVSYLLQFSEAVTGVDVSDFSLSTTGDVKAKVAQVKALSASQYQVSVNQISGAGQLTLSLNGSGTGIQDLMGFALGAGGSGPTYLIKGGRPQTSVDTSQTNDNDGVSAEIENSVPGLVGLRGDGNGDGIPDAIQSNVSSMPWNNNVVQNRYVTLVTPTGQAPQHVQALASPLNLPEGLNLPYGILSFDQNGLSTGASTTATILTDFDSRITGYWVQDKAGNWVNLATSVSEQSGHLRLDLTLQDGAAYDLDGKVDGVVTLRGGPGFRLNNGGTNTSVGKPGDTDGDGIPDLVEIRLGTNPAVKDNDVVHRDDLFVMQLYRDMLFREADAQGLQFWQNALQQGMTRADLAKTFLSAVEFNNQVGSVTRLYFGAFDRVPDKSGLQFWVDAEKQGISLNQIANLFVQSPEFQTSYGQLTDQQFVDRVYQNVLHRAADAAGAAFWQSALQQGVSRGEVLAGFTNSPEFQSASANKVAVTLSYVGLLGKTPDAATLNQALTQSQSGVDLIGQILNGSDYSGRFL